MPLTILVVDDELAIRLGVTDYLETSGYSVIAAEYGERALEMLEYITLILLLLIS